MSPKIKNLLGIAIIITILVLAFAAVNYVRTYSDSIDPGSRRNFAVNGESKVIAVPDVAQFTLSVITEGGRDLGNLQKQNTDKVNKIIEFISSKGVEAKDVKTQNYNVEPRYQNFICLPPPPYSAEGSSDSGKRSCPPPEIMGYTITQTISVKVRDFNKTGELLSGVVEKGSNSVSKLEFIVDDPTNLQNQARAEAFVKAREKAESLARTGGFSLGKLISIEESGFPPPYYYGDYGYGGGAASSGRGADAFIPPNIQPGSQEIKVSIILRYEIK